jgi:hypothetical protein
MNMRPATILYFVLVTLLLMVGYAYAADNKITVDQVGSGNTITVEQIGKGHQATVNMGSATDVDNVTLTILQQGTGAKTATVAIPAGINNTVNIQQDGSGNHVAGIQNLNGSGNSVTVNQSGAGKHELNVIGAAGATNNGNTITGNQSGGAGADKWFNVNLNGATGATVNVVQDNATTADQASMNIQCLSGTCGTYGYIKH